MKINLLTNFILICLLSFSKISFAQNLKEVNSISIEDKEITSVNISPDNKFVICGFANGTIITFDALSGKKIYERNRHIKDVHSIAFDKKGKYFVSAGQDNTIAVWTISTGKQLKTFTSGDAVWTAQFAPNGKYLASAGTDQLISVWEIMSGKRYRTFRGHNNRVYELKISPDGKYIFSGSADYTLRKWDISKQLSLNSVKAHDNDLTSLDISDDCSLVVTASQDNTVKIWDYNTLENIALLRGHQWWINKVDISPDAKFIASGSDDNTLIIWDVEAREKVKTLEHPAAVVDLAFSKDGTYLVSCDAHTVRIFATGFPEKED